MPTASIASRSRSALACSCSTVGRSAGPVADEMANEWERVWPQWALVWRTQFRSGGALMFTARDLALAGQW
jgi:hypothetical protein